MDAGTAQQVGYFLIAVIHSGPTEEVFVNKTVSAVALCAVAGLIIGYLVFGRVAGSYVSLQALLTPAQSGLARFGRSIARVPEIRRNILLSGAAGAVVGFVLMNVLGRR